MQPSGDFCFNVAIRTLSGKNGHYTLGVGGGIVWDSNPEAEYAEALSKMEFVHAAIPSFELIETFRLDADGTYAYRDEHLDRMQRSALYWQYAFDRDKINRLLDAYITQCDNTPAVVRLTSNQAGAVSISERPMTAIPNEVTIVVSQQRVHSSNRFLFHKTTHRHFYQTERQRLTSDQIFEVVFQNEKGHITEGCITNIGYRIQNVWYTPPLDDGLLPGVWRAGFLRTHNARERSLSLPELQQADEVVIGNAVLETIRVDRIRVEARRASA